MKNYLLLLTLPILIVTLSSYMKTANVNVDHTCVDFDIRNIRNNQGTFSLAFYKDPNTFLKKGGELFAREVHLGTSVEQLTQICGLDTGWYAVAAFQDLDNSGDMKYNMIGMPKEPYGFSNGVKPMFKAPSFNQCRFYVSTANKAMVKVELINP